MIDANQRFDSSRFEEGEKRIFQQNLMIDETFEATTVNKTNPGAIHLRFCVWLRSGHHEDGRLADVHLRHILHPQTLPREGGGLQTKKGIKRTCFCCRAASIIPFSASTHFGSLPALPSSSSATTLLPSGSERR